MSKLLKYLKKYKIESILAPFFKLIEVTFELIVPLIVSTIIDVGIENGDKVYIIKRCLLLGLFGILGLCSTLVAQYFSAKASVGFATDIRHALFKHIGKLSYSQLDSLGAPTLITRLTGDINQVQTGTNLTLRLVLRSPFVVFGAVIMAFTVDVKSSLVFVVAVPALAAVVFAIMLVCIPMYRKVQQKLDGLLSKTRENLLGTRVVRAFCKEEEEIADFDAKNSALTEMQTAVGRISAFMNPATFVLINLAIIALIYVGAIRVDSGAISRGAVVALYNYMSQILVELIKLANLIISVTKAIACGNRIQSVLDIEPATVPGTVTDGNENSEYSVEFDKACLSYNGSEESLHNIDLKIKRGSSIGVIGSTGSGKTSLVNLIPRFYDVTGGCVLVDGVDVRDYDTKALRSKIGVVSQKKSPVRRHCQGQYPLRQAGRHRRRNLAGARNGAGKADDRGQERPARLCPRTGGQEPLGRSAPKNDYSPRPRQKTRGAHPRRCGERTRLRHRCGAEQGAEKHRLCPDRHHCVPARCGDKKRRYHSRPRRGRDSRHGHERRASALVRSLQRNFRFPA